MREQPTINAKAAGLAVRGINMAAHHVVETLQPNEARDFITLRRVVGGADALWVGEHLFYVLNHHAVEVARVLLFLREPRIHVLRHAVARRAVVELLLVVIHPVWPRARRTEIRVQTLPAPCGFDDENRLIERRVHHEAKGELRADLVAGLGGILPPHRAITRR